MNNVCEILYQIMPDKFNIGGSKTVFQKSEKGLYPDKEKIVKWNSRIKSFQNDIFFGGDLPGIIEKIPYLKELGVTMLYLTPVYKSYSSHKYDIVDFRQIDPAFGSEADFLELIEKLHIENIKIIIDVVPNHTSDQSFYFKSALKDKNSKYVKYYNFSEYPEKYQCWRNVGMVPELNYSNPEVVEEFITGENSYIRYWIRRGIDGIRIDCCNDLGMDLTSKMRRVVKEENSEAVVIGEVWNFSADWHKYLDGTQSYFFTDSAYSVFKGKITSAQFGKNITNMIKEPGIEQASRSLLQLSSHDYKRILNSIGNNKKIYFALLMLQFTLPGIPMIYYGEEVGLKGPYGGKDPFNRGAMVWDENKQDKRILENYKLFIGLRKSKRELFSGDFRDFSEWLDNGVISYIRYMKSDYSKFSLVFINTKSKPVKFRFYLPYSYLFDSMELNDFFTGKRYKYTNYLDIKLKAYESILLNPDSKFIDNYDFYKRIKFDN